MVAATNPALIFIALTVDFHRREPEFAHNENITEQVVQGKKVWHKYNCNNCHTILGFGGYYAPDMTKAYYRLGEGNITHVVMNPEKVYQNSFRKMPKLGVTAEEAKDLVAFLKWTAEIENRKWPPQGEKYVRAARAREAQAKEVPRTDLVLGSCGGCHSFANQGRDVAGDHADLARSSIFDRETTIRYMLDPAAVSPGSGMPPPTTLPGEGRVDCGLRPRSPVRDARHDQVRRFRKKSDYPRFRHSGESRNPGISRSYNFPGPRFSPG